MGKRYRSRHSRHLAPPRPADPELDSLPHWEQVVMLSLLVELLAALSHRPGQPRLRKR